MPFLTINGIEPPVEDWTEDVEEINGGSVRAFDGTAITTRTALKRVWTAKTTIELTEAEMKMWRCILRGEGHVWSFDNDRYSAKGLGPNSSVDGEVSVTQKKYGTAAWYLTSGEADVFATGYSGDKTILLWRKYASGSFEHWALTRTAAGTDQYYKDGVTNSSVPFLTCDNAGSVTLTTRNEADSADANVYFDDFAVYPALFTADAIADIAGNSAAIGDCPQLVLNGDAVQDEATYAHSEAASVKITPIKAQATRYQIDFKLMEE